MPKTPEGLTMYRIVRKTIAATLMPLLVISGCASLPEGVLVPTEIGVTGTTLLPLLVATTRAPDENPGLLFSGERGNTIDLTEIVVSIPPEENREIGEVQWPKKLPADPLKYFATASVNTIADRAAADAWLRQNPSPSGRLLVFVHGFNNRYEDAVYRFAQIAHDSGTRAVPLLFTWPSRGSVFAYGYDKESTNYSRTALEALLTTAAESSQFSEITILAHSMGTWLTVESLRQMAIRNGSIPDKISNVILASPDLDIDVFRQQLIDMGPKRPKFSVFVSKDDRALKVSRRISGNVDRLGQLDIEDEQNLELFAAEGITVFDLSALRAGDRLNHSKFAQSPEVVRLLGDRLIAGQTVTDQNVGLGEQIGATALSVSNTVGSAVGVAASVPISIVDPNTRRTLQDQTDRLGQGIENSVTGIIPVLPANQKYKCPPQRPNCNTRRP